MQTFLFAGGLRQLTHKSPGGPTIDYCSQVIVRDKDYDSAHNLFSDWLLSHGDQPVIAQRVVKIVSAPMLDQLLTESGQRPINWETIDDEVQASLSEEETDDQGYWADVNGIVPRNFNVHELLARLPEDIRAGLNWNAERKFFFLLRVLCAPKADQFSDPSDVQDESTDELDLAQVRDGQIDFPELAEMELSVLIEARNAVVAACLWRKHAASSAIATNDIRIDSWCEVLAAAVQ